MDKKIFYNYKLSILSIYTIRTTKILKDLSPKVHVHPLF